MRLSLKIGSLLALTLSLAVTTACMKPKGPPVDEKGAPCPQPKTEDIRVCLNDEKAKQETETCAWTCPEDFAHAKAAVSGGCAAVQRVCKDGSAASKGPNWGQGRNCKQVCPEDTPATGTSTSVSTVTATSTATVTAVTTDTSTVTITQTSTGN